MSSTPAFFSAVSGSRVDRENGIIEGVSVITEGEAKGHGVTIDNTTLQQVKECAEQFSDGVQVKVNHGTGFDSIVGVLRNFRIDGQKLLADLHLLRSHEKREVILDIAESMPGSVGLSIAFSGKAEKNKARCSELYSVDFVDRPAANPSGLFSHVDSPPQGMDSKSLLTKFKEFLSGVEKEVGAPVDFQAKASELETQLSAKATEFAALQSKVTELEAAKLKIEGDLKASLDKQTDFDAKVEKAAAEKAAAINANLGVPPATTKPDGGTKLDFSALVKAQEAKGMKQSEAVAFCVKNHTAEYAEWRKSGNTQSL